MTWEEAAAYVRSTIDETCARQGIAVEIEDPALLALNARYFRAGKRNLHPLRTKVTPTATRE